MKTFEELLNHIENTYEDVWVLHGPLAGRGIYVIQGSNLEELKEKGWGNHCRIIVHTLESPLEPEELPELIERVTLRVRYDSPKFTVKQHILDKMERLKQQVERLLPGCDVDMEEVRRVVVTYNYDVPFARLAVLGNQAIVFENDNILRLTDKEEPDEELCMIAKNEKFKHEWK